jgi:hypothetical protein
MRLQRPYLRAIEVLEDLIQIRSPMDMLSNLVAMSTQLYACATQYNKDRVVWQKKRIERQQQLQLQLQQSLSSSSSISTSTTTTTPALKEIKLSEVGADHFMPILIYVLVQSNIPHIHRRLSILKHYSSETTSESAYYLTCVESALMYISSVTCKQLEADANAE